MMRLRRLFFAAAFLLLLPSFSNADIRVFDFDDGTLQGFEYVNINDEPYPVDDPDQTGVGWVVSEADVDIGDGFDLLQGSSVNGIGETGNPQRETNARIIPEPWANRDCLGALICQTQLLKSPTFMLDDSGPISVDIMGGQAQGGRNFDPDLDLAPEFPGDFDELKTAEGWQGFALYDVADDNYVRWAFSYFQQRWKRA